MQTVSTPDRPTGAIRYVLRRVDLARYGVTSRHLRWFPDYRDEQMHAQLQRDIAAINAYDAQHPELMAELDTLADEMMASLPEYDWGPEGPPV